MARVKLSQRDLGQSGWVGILPERNVSGALEHDIETDFLVVGAGFAGLSAVRRLQQLEPQARIVILEASRVAEGPAGRNSGFMIDLPHVLSSKSYAGEESADLTDTRMNRAAIQFAKTQVDDFKLPDETFRNSGKINAAASQTGLKRNYLYARHLDKLKEPYRLIDAKEMSSTTGSDYYRGGLWTPGTATIQPVIYIRGLADAVTNFKRTSLFENSAVTALEKKADRWLASTPNGSVLANKVILAVNGLIENFGYYKRRLIHINLFGSMTRKLTQDEIERLGGESNWGITPADPLGSTVRRVDGSGGHRILIRNRCTYNSNLKLPTRQLSKVAKGHDITFRRRFPNLNDVAMQYCWSGRLCLSRNNVWAIGKVAENVYSACCQNGLGTTKGTIAGIVTAEMASENKTDSCIPDYKKEQDPKKLWPEPLMTIGARSYLRIREWSAGLEL